MPNPHSPIASFPTHVAPTRYLTHDTPGIGGVLKQHDPDFLVEEIPLYEPCGRGDHIYLFVEKRGMSTNDMVRVLARHFRVSHKAIGTAGLKDKRAFTRQLVSIHAPHKNPEDFGAIDHHRLTVLWVDLHTNKLKRGHLSGNRFSIRIRGVEATAAIHAKKALDTLERIGVPNRVGKQRFGYLANNHLIGRAILLGRDDETLDLLVGPNERDPQSQRDARAHYAAGDFRAAFEAMPRVYRVESKVLGVLAEGGDHAGAVRAIDPTSAGFFVSAFQSAVFNAVLNRRLADETIGRMLEGDLLAPERERELTLVDAANMGGIDLCERFGRRELNPTGPMWGSQMPRAGGVVDETEVAALAGAGLSPENFTRAGLERIDMTRGTRRPLRIALRDPIVEGGADAHGPFVRVAFELPRGAFATTVMDEIMKSDPLASEAIETGARATRQTEDDTGEH